MFAIGSPNAKPFEADIILIPFMDPPGCENTSIQLFPPLVVLYINVPAGEVVTHALFVSIASIFKIFPFIMPGFGFPFSHVVPPFVVRLTVPEAPAVQHTSSLSAFTENNNEVVPDCWGVQM